MKKCTKQRVSKTNILLKTINPFIVRYCNKRGYVAGRGGGISKGVNSIRPYKLYNWHVLPLVLFAHSRDIDIHQRCCVITRYFHFILSYDRDPRKLLIKLLYLYYTYHY